jgi:phosphatidylinositol alpha-1,6-mannosyltransferase
LAALVQAGLDVGYVVVGTGPDRDRLERLAASLGVLERVRFAGFVPDDLLPSYYHGCDLFALISRHAPGRAAVEGFGIVFLEAGACGRPVLGGRSGGVADAVAEGESGLLVDPGDVEEVAGALSRLLTDGALARRLGEGGRQRVQRSFDWARRSEEVRKVLLDAHG